MLLLVALFACMLTCLLRHIQVWCWYPPTVSKHHLGTPPYPSWSVNMLCLLCKTYNDDASVLPPTLVWSLPIARAWSRSLSWLFSALVCDLLPRRSFHGSPKAHSQKSVSVTILTSTAWRTLGLFGAFPTLVGGHHWSLGATLLGS